MPIGGIGVYIPAVLTDYPVNLHELRRYFGDGVRGCANGRRGDNIRAPCNCVVYVGNCVVCGGELLENDLCVNVGDSTSGVVVGVEGDNILVLRK